MTPQRSSGNFVSKVLACLDAQMVATKLEEERAKLVEQAEAVKPAVGVEGSSVLSVADGPDSIASASDVFP